MRLTFNKDFALRRRLRNFSQSFGHDNFFAFFLHEPFFERRRLTSPSTHAGQLRRLNVLRGMYSVATSRKIFLHFEDFECFCSNAR